MGPRKRIITYSAILVVLLYAAAECCALLVLYLAEKGGNIRYTPISLRTLSPLSQRTLGRLLSDGFEYLAFHPVLGWTIRPNGESGLYRANAQGLRSDKEYGAAPPPGYIRIASFGDSFTHGDEVANEETWQEAINRSGRRLEVMNFGVPAYGLDQAFVRYLHEGAAFEPDIVLIGFMSENINRNVNTFPPFYVPDAAVPLSKPRFVVAGGKLDLLPNPIGEIGRYEDLLAAPHDILPGLSQNDFFANSIRGFYTSGPEDVSPLVRLCKMVWFSAQRKMLPGLYADPAAEPFQVTAKLFDRFYAAAIANGSAPALVFFPNRADVASYKTSVTKPYESMLAYLAERGYAYADCLDIFDGRYESVVTDAFFASQSGAAHYSPTGNRFVADHVLRFLCREDLILAEGRDCGIAPRPE